MGVRKHLKMGRSGGYKLSVRDYKKAIAAVQAYGPARRKARNVKRVKTAAMAFKRVTGKPLPAPAAFNITSYLG